jgi:hypothetical protein
MSGEFQDLEKIGSTKGLAAPLKDLSYKKRFPTLYSGDKPTLSTSEVIDLLTNHFIVNEKILGTTRATRWREDPDIVLFFCDMRIQRWVHYEKLPGPIILFEATYYGTGVRLPFEKLLGIGKHIGFPVVANRAVYLNGIKAEDIGAFLQANADNLTSVYGSSGNGGFIIFSEADLNLAGKFDRYDTHSTTDWEAAQDKNIINRADAGRKRRSQVNVK